MKNIVDITVTQVRVYATDSLPFADLRRADNLKTVKETFRFENIQSDPLGLQLGFSNGTFEHRGKSVHILSLTVEPRRVLIQVRGRSSMADALYSAFSDILANFAGQPKGSKFEPLLKAEETACVATLDIDFDDLVAPPLLRFIQTDGKAKLRTEFGSPKSVTFKTLSFEVKYSPVSPQLEEHDVALSSKLMTFEPRLATPLREKRFFTSSPTDSETHLAILEALEKEVAKSSAKNRQVT
jgi:hypothetical protein